MERRIAFTEIQACWRESERIAAELGIDLTVRVRGRLRDPAKAELLRAAGVPEDLIGPVGARRFHTRA